jgi:hypothetical protein
MVFCCVVTELFSGSAYTILPRTVFVNRLGLDPDSARQQIFSSATGHGVVHLFPNIEICFGTTPYRATAGFTTTASHHRILGMTHISKAYWALTRIDLVYLHK